MCIGNVIMPNFLEKIPSVGAINYANVPNTRQYIIYIREFIQTTWILYNENMYILEL